jgi:hypothetical protein
MLIVSNAAAHLSQVTSAAVFGHIDMQHIVAVINESTNRQIIIIEAASRTRNLIDFFVNALIGGGAASVASFASCGSDTGAAFTFSSGAAATAASLVSTAVGFSISFSFMVFVSFVLKKKYEIIDICRCPVAGFGHCPPHAARRLSICVVPDPHGANQGKRKPPVTQSVTRG